MITELRYITIVVKDIETSLAWYTEKMGFEKRMDIKNPARDGLRSLWLA